MAEGTKTTSFLYDADGTRLLKRAPDGVTLYLGATELKLTGSGPAGTVCGTRYYSHGTSPTLVRTCDGNVSIQIADHHGTAQLAIDSATGAVTRRSTTPFGADRGTPPTLWPGSKGFVGGTKDDSTGLTHLGAREYDPATGRFISVDPVLNPSDPQALNAYAYANNAPVTSSDPSGMVRAPLPDDDSASPAPGTDSADQPIPRPPAEKVEEAKKIKKKTLVDVVIEAGGEILMEVLGINDIRDCFTKGSIGACASMIMGAIPWGKIFKAKKIAKALERAYDAYRSFEKRLAEANAILKWADAAAYASRKADDLRDLIAKKGTPDSGGPNVPIACESNSFTPDTPVEMADGTAKPIDQVQVGDQVLATDPEQNTTEAHTVLATIIGTGTKNLVEITVDTDGPAGTTTDTITATDHHPFWTPETGQWTDATDLQPGQWIQTSAGTHVQITAVKRWTQQATVRNLTVADIHTYYVLAGATPVLVHNCSLSDRASEIHGAEPDDYVRKNISTVAVVRVQTPHGPVDLIAGSGDGLTPAQMSVPLNPGEMHVPNISGTHAEQNAFMYANANGWTPIAGGTSRNVCLAICAPWIRGTGGKMMGNVFPGSGVTTTRQRSFEW